MVAWAGVAGACKAPPGSHELFCPPILYFNFSESKRSETHKTIEMKVINVLRQRPQERR